MDRNDRILLIALVILIALSLLVWAIIAGAFDAPSQTGWIYNWQTLIGAVVALAAGIAAYLAVRLQIKDTRAQLRAHIAATLGGIKTTTTGEYVGHVIFRNVGRMPAYNFVCPPPRIIATGEIWEPPEWSGHIPETEKVLPAGTPEPIGSEGIWQAEIDMCLAEPKFLYVWGRITYTDGFDRSRFTNFCHRYPWARRETITGGEVRIAEEYGRRTDKGNEAN